MDSKVLVSETSGITCISLSTIVWAVFMILGYGFNVEWLSNRFWIFFPLWIIPAIIIGICILIGIIYGIYRLVTYLKEKPVRKAEIERRQVENERNALREAAREQEMAAVKAKEERLEQFIKSHYDIDARLRFGLNNFDNCERIQQELLQKARQPGKPLKELIMTLRTKQDLYLNSYFAGVPVKTIIKCDSSLIQDGIVDAVSIDPALGDCHNYISIYFGEIIDL